MTAPRSDRSDQAAPAAPVREARAPGPPSQSTAAPASDQAATQPDRGAGRLAVPSLLRPLAALAGLAALGGLAGLALATAGPEGSTSPAATASPSPAPSAAPAAGAAPTPKAIDDRLGDIQSLYAWMDADATHVNLVMTLSPFDDGTTAFGPGFQYAFHIGVHDSLGAPSLNDEVLILCQFPGPTEIECWVGKTYLRGNPSLTDGLYSENRLVRVFAGRRSDPFFFNGAGFENARAQLRTYLPPEGQVRCPTIAPTDAASILTKLRTPASDRFDDTNVLALVMTIDKRSLGIRPSTPLLSVWGSTHRQ